MRMEIDESPFLIAEIGASHDGDFHRAMHLINVAASSGFNAVKFQLYNSERLAARRNAASYLDKYRPYELPQEWLPHLRDKAHERGLKFVLSVYDQGNLDDDGGYAYADIVKVSSFEAGDYSLLRRVVEHRNPLIVSAGMATEEELLSLCAFREAAVSDVAILHCVSAYPAPVGELDLNVIRQYRLDGFSDHSASKFMGAIAVAAGAKIIEVHVRDYSTSEQNPDYRHALSMSAAHSYCLGAKVAAQAMGVGRRSVNACEVPMTAYKVRA